VRGVARSDHHLGEVCPVGGHHAVRHKSPEAVGVEHSAHDMLAEDRERSHLLRGGSAGLVHLRRVQGADANAPPVDHMVHVLRLSSGGIRSRRVHWVCCGNTAFEETTQQVAPDDRHTGEHQHQLQVLPERGLQPEDREHHDLRRHRDDARGAASRQTRRARSKACRVSSRCQTMPDQVSHCPQAAT